ncbi:MFS transporter [Actinosynnema sp. NPDC053489]|uniref:MFS transporter n=1 Tax=Actinosynnema sp. NPDC053489 TaxID=3363916 RepID=UPI0037C7BFA4
MDRVRAGARRRGVVLPASAQVAFLAAAAAPTPLYPVLQRSWGLPPSALTAAFATYALSLLAALLVVGSLSDHVGRRPVVLGALGLDMAAMAVFALADGLTPLLVARAAQGVATGAAAGALGGWVLDVDRERGAAVNSVAPVAGMAVGAAGGGALVDRLPAPWVLFAGLLLVLGLLAGVVLAAPEPIGARRAGFSPRPAVRVPPAARPPLARVAPVVVASWALGGFHLSLGPNLARAVVGAGTALGAGLFVASFFAAGALAVWALRSVAVAVVVEVAAGALAVGAAAGFAGVWWSSGPALLAGTAVAGVGFGAGLVGGLRAVAPFAAPHERAGLVAAFYVISYLGTSVPAVAAGIAADRFGVAPVAAVHTAAPAVLVVVGAALRVLRRRAR